MQLTRRALILILLTALPLAGAAWQPALLWLAGGWAVAAGALLVADWRLSPPAAAWEVARRHDQRLSLAVPNPVTVTVRLRRGLRPTPVTLRDEPPPAFAVAEGRLLSGRAVPAGPSITLAYTVRPPRRGQYYFGDLHLRWGSPLGLVRRQARFPAAAPVQVYPNLADVKKYDLLLRRNRLWEMGVRPVRVPGAGSEFERLRDYLPDDEYRRINWKATARRNKPISVEYETERSQNLMVLLDVGRMMRSPVGDVEKLDYAINAVLLLAYVALQKGDRIGFLSFADGAQNWIGPRGGRGQFHQMLEQLYKLDGQPVEPDYATAFGYFAAKQVKRSLVLVFTDLTGSISADQLVAQMARLRHSHLPLLVTIADPTIQRMARRPIADSTALYERTAAEQLLEERRLALERLRRAGVATLDAPADELSIALINRYIELKERAFL